MSKSAIEWTDATWNPLAGCTKVSPGCDNCYALRDSWRIMHNEKRPDRYNGVCERVGKWPQWTGVINLDWDEIERPLRWRKPRMIFVCSMSDLFHPDVPDQFIKRVWGTMARTPQHTYQVLTKRAGIMRFWAKELNSEPLPNAWLGVTAENQAWADRRIPRLLEAPAAVRFVSVEPQVGRVELAPYLTSRPTYPSGRAYRRPALDWVIVGAESGPSGSIRHLLARDAVQVVADCDRARVPVFVKQIHVPVCRECGGSGYVGDGRGGGEPCGCNREFRVSKDPAEWPPGLRVREYPDARG